MAGLQTFIPYRKVKRRVRVNPCCRLHFPGSALRTPEPTFWPLLFPRIPSLSPRRYFVPNPSYSESRKARSNKQQQQQQPALPAGAAADPKAAGAAPPATGSTTPAASSPPRELELLKGITGFTQPGSMTALMGGSGAGGRVPGSVWAVRRVY